MILIQMTCLASVACNKACVNGSITVLMGPDLTKETLQMFLLLLHYADRYADRPISLTRVCTYCHQYYSNLNYFCGSLFVRV